MGRKVISDVDARPLVFILLGVSLVVTTGWLGLFENDDDDKDPDHPDGICI